MAAFTTVVADTDTVDENESYEMFEEISDITTLKTMNSTAEEERDTQVEDTEGDATKSTSVATEKLVQLPMSRIKHLIKMDPEVTLASQEAVFLVTKCTELFIESLARESYLHTSKAKRKTVQRKDIDQAISTVDSLAFLEGVLNTM